MQTIAINDRTLRLVQGDIVAAKTEVIVNAANSLLAPGAGVCGAIFRAAGPALAEELRGHKGCGPGCAVITGAGAMAQPVRFIVHAVAPVYDPEDDANCAITLASSYESALGLADSRGVTSIAFPSLGTGSFGYPIAKAAPIALKAVATALTSANSIREATFVLFTEADLATYASALETIAPSLTKL